jgi:multisubunit Na+/H+ antiporter MnhG subunit
MKKLIILGALAIFLAAHGVVTAMTIYQQLDAYSCISSNC